MIWEFGILEFRMISYNGSVKRLAHPTGTLLAGSCKSLFTALDQHYSPRVLSLRMFAPMLLTEIGSVIVVYRLVPFTRNQERDDNHGRTLSCWFMSMNRERYSSSSGLRPIDQSRIYPLTMKLGLENACYD